jgi:hypothetical protein
MAENTIERPVLNAHGAKRLPSVEVDSYNLEIKDRDGFVGDKASRGAFRDMLEKWREPLRKLGADPLEDYSELIDKKTLDKLLAEGDPEAAGVIHSAVEDFAQTLMRVGAAPSASWWAAAFAKAGWASSRSAAPRCS